MGTKIEVWKRYGMVLVTRLKGKLVTWTKKFLRIFHYKIRVVYDSPRGRQHNFFFECELDIARITEPPESEVNDITSELINSHKFTIVNAPQDYKDVVSFMLSYSDVQIGLASESVSMEKEEYQTMKVYKVGHRV